MASIFLRLDTADNYAELVDIVRSFGARVHPELEQIVESIGHQDERRGTIRRTALQLLRSTDLRVRDE